jgi:hypothetical protein
VCVCVCVCVCVFIPISLSHTHHAHLHAQLRDEAWQRAQDVCMLGCLPLFFARVRLAQGTAATAHSDFEEGDE